MRCSLVVLAFLATAFGSNLEDVTNAPTSSLKVGADDLNSTPVGLDEDVETKTKDPKTMNDIDGMNVVEEDYDQDEDQNKNKNEDQEEELVEQEKEKVEEDQEEDDEKTVASSLTMNPGFNEVTPAPTPTSSRTSHPTKRLSPTLRPSVPSASADNDQTIVPSRTINPGLNGFTPDVTPTFSFTSHPTKHRSPTLRPVVPYVSTDDDPLGKGDDLVSNIEDWFSNESTIEEMEHDKSVIITMSILFGVMFFFSIFVAYQMLENPDGCCASLCRITVACWCALCYPCRAICGCTGPSGGQHMMVPDDGHFTHDLELS